jgi:hypothetical protein
MIVRCSSLHEGDLGPRRADGTRVFCNEMYDDSKQWTICPHTSLDTLVKNEQAIVHIRESRKDEK